MKLSKFSVLALFLGAAACSSPPPPVKVDFIVFGSASSVLVTYMDGTGNIEQKTAAIPWEHSFSASKGAYVSVSAQNQDDDGDVKVLIRADGKTVNAASSSGAYVVVATEAVLK